MLFALAPYCMGQNWAVGVDGGYGVYHDVTIKNGGASADAGFGSRFAAGAVLTEDMYNHVGGELRYAFRDGDSELSSNGHKVNMDGFAQAIHYDFLFYATPRHTRLRPFVAAGAGIKRYDATSHVAQSFGNLGTLTHAHQVEGMLSVGGGLKVALSDRWVLRLDFRDYATPLPDKLFAPAMTANVHGWLHDFVPTIGVDWTFGAR